MQIYFNMKRSILLTALIVSGLLFSGCNERRNDNLIDEGDAELEFDKFVDSVSVVGIMTDGDIMLVDISKIVMADDTTYIILDSKQRALIKMTADGEIIDKFQRLGRGPNEYVQINDFDIAGEDIYLLCDEERIIVVDLDFNLLRTIILGQVPPCQRIAYFDNEWYLYSHHAWTVYKFYENDTPAPIVKSKRSNEGIYFTHEPVFHKTGDAMLVCMSRDDIIYKIENNRHKKFFTLNWRNKEERYRILSELDPHDIDVYAINIPLSIKNLIVDGERLAIFYSRGYLRMAVADIKTGEILHDGIAFNALDYSFPVMDIDDDPVAFSFVADSLKNRSLYNLNCRIDEGDDAVLVRYKMKNL